MIKKAEILRLDMANHDGMYAKGLKQIRKISRDAFNENNVSQCSQKRL